MDREMSKPPDNNNKNNQISLAGHKPSTNDQTIRCPRCDSPNTKFCYYNNYSLTQPRHFCKSCRRYWTKGGALRNVPIGGGVRKSKKARSTSSPSSDVSHLKFFHGISSAMEFRFGGVPFSRLHSPTAASFTQFFSTSALENVACTNTSTSLEGFSYPSATTLRLGESGVFGGGIKENIASSIESLSSINQDLHWKLQQQRLAMISAASTSLIENQPKQQQPISFPIAESSKTEATVDGSHTNELFLENSYTLADGTSNINMSNWNEMQTWNDMHHQYSEFP